MEIRLNPSGVVFDEHRHLYSLNGKPLKGITGMIGRQLFPDKYDGIPQDVLKKAAEYGSSVHSTIELCDSLGDHSNPDPIYQAYRKLFVRRRSRAYRQRVHRHGLRAFRHAY